MNKIKILLALSVAIISYFMASTAIADNQFKGKLGTDISDRISQFIVEENTYTFYGLASYYNTIHYFLIKSNSIKNIKLPVSAPFHCKLMNKATEIMKSEIEKSEFLEAKTPLISNVTAKEISDLVELKRLLIDQIENRVRWREGVNYMIDNGINHFIEIGPGKVLSGLVKRISKDVKINAINDEIDIKDLKI